jgi:predicted DNA-binding protein YlxM (UPF0122 family)
MEIEKFAEILKLFETYQNLLSDEQFNVLSSYLEEGLMNSEIAENNSISRQAVGKTFKTAVSKLENLETALGIVKFRETLTKSLDKISDFLENGNTKQALLEISKLKEL